MRLDDFLSVRDHQLSVVVEKPVQHFKHFRWREIQLVKYNPMPFSHCGDERTLLEDKVSHGIAHICAKVFLDVGVCVIVDAYKLVTGAKGEILHKRRFACIGNVKNCSK
jgi:hypothetical protein